MAAESYDPDTCWLAPQLREVGVYVPREVPDEAWIPRSEMKFETGKSYLRDGGYVECKVHVTYLGRFRLPRRPTKEGSTSRAG